MAALMFCRVKLLKAQPKHPYGVPYPPQGKGLATCAKRGRGVLRLLALRLRLRHGPRALAGAPRLL